MGATTGRTTRNVLPSLSHGVLYQWFRPRTIFMTSETIMPQAGVPGIGSKLL
ncbi:MAG: hypothetical protein ACKVIR_08525 [Candidatus Poseidoniales archaeon]